MQGVEPRKTRMKRPGEDRFFNIVYIGRRCRRGGGAQTRTEILGFRDRCTDLYTTPHYSDGRIRGLRYRPLPDLPFIRSPSCNKGRPYRPRATSPASLHKLAPASTKFALPTRLLIRKDHRAIGGTRGIRTLTWQILSLLPAAVGLPSHTPGR